MECQPGRGGNLGAGASQGLKGPRKGSCPFLFPVVIEQTRVPIMKLRLDAITCEPSELLLLQQGLLQPKPAPLAIREICGAGESGERCRCAGAGRMPGPRPRSHLTPRPLRTLLLLHLCSVRGLRHSTRGHPRRQEARAEGELCGCGLVAMHELGMQPASSQPA